jgi:hypothetical protein
MASLSPAMINLLHRAMRTPNGEGAPLRGHQHITARALDNRGLGVHFRRACRFYVRPALIELVAAARRGDI